MKAISSHKITAMNSDSITNIPYVPRTQLPKSGYTLMDRDGITVLANACPMNILTKSKWWMKFSQMCSLNGIKQSFFEEMARKRCGAKLAYGQGLYAVSVQTQYASLTLLENSTYILKFSDPKGVNSECHPMVVKSINIHKDNRVAWIWLE